MTDNRPAERIRKLVALAGDGDTAEARSAATKAAELIMGLNTELLSTLEGQRRGLLDDLRYEHRRLISAKERATKQDTGDLVGRAMLLFNHYEGIDVLIPVVMLLRIGAGHTLTNEERQQLDGPVDDLLSRWSTARRENRRAEREARKAARRQHA
jgi:hypothetical protein